MGRTPVYRGGCLVAHMSEETRAKCRHCKNVSNSPQRNKSSQSNYKGKNNYVVEHYRTERIETTSLDNYGQPASKKKLNDKQLAELHLLEKNAHKTTKHLGSKRDGYFDEVSSRWENYGKLTKAPNGKIICPYPVSRCEARTHNTMENCQAYRYQKIVMPAVREAEKKAAAEHGRIEREAKEERLREKLAEVSAKHQNKTETRPLKKAAPAPAPSKALAEQEPKKRWWKKKKQTVKAVEEQEITADYVQAKFDHIQRDWFDYEIGTNDLRWSYPALMDINYPPAKAYNELKEELHARMINGDTNYYDLNLLCDQVSVQWVNLETHARKVGKDYLSTADRITVEYIPIMVQKLADPGTTSSEKEQAIDFLLSRTGRLENEAIKSSLFRLFDATEAELKSSGFKEPVTLERAVRNQPQYALMS